MKAQRSSPVLCDPGFRAVVLQHQGYAQPPRERDTRVVAEGIALVDEADIGVREPLPDGSKAASTESVLTGFDRDGEHARRWQRYETRAIIDQQPVPRGEQQQ